MHEPRFGAEIFAAILSIPATKTLLRRHLSTHFVALVGGAVQQLKRGVEMQPGYVPLAPSHKVKVRICLLPFMAYSYSSTLVVYILDNDS